MSPKRRPKSSAPARRKSSVPGWAIYAGLFLFALALRTVYLLEIKKAIFFNVPIIDAERFDEWAVELSKGDWIGKETFYQAPLYPYVMGVLYAVFGRSLMAVRILQILLGSASCVILARAGAFFFSRRIGLAAGGLMALYPVAIFFDGIIQKTTLGLFLMCGLLYFLGLLRLRYQKRWAAASGILLGLMVLVRENCLILVPLIFFWILAGFRRFPLRSRLAVAAVSMLGLSAVLLPVAVRNRAVGGEFVVTTTNFGPNLYSGNNEMARGSYVPLRERRGHPDFEKKDATEIAEADLKKTLTPMEVSLYWARKAASFIESHPFRWLALCMKKVALTWNDVEIADGENIETYRTESALLNGLEKIFRFGVLAPLAFAGILLTRIHRRRLCLLYGFLATITFSIALFFVFGRFRFDLVPVLALFASAAVVRGAPLIRRRRFRRLIVPLAAGLAAAAFSNAPFVSASFRTSFSRSMWWDVGNVLVEKGRFGEASAAFERALPYGPVNANLLYALGNAQSESGDLNAAKNTLLRATRIRPALVPALFGLARISVMRREYAEAIGYCRRILRCDSAHSGAYFIMGSCFAAGREYAKAVECYVRAAERDPSNVQIHYNCGTVYFKMGRLEGAAGEYRTILRIKPDEVSAWNGLGILYYQQGKFGESAGCFARSLALNAGDPDIHYNLGVVYEKQGRFDLARREWESALRLNPGHGKSRMKISGLTGKMRPPG
jgi:Tfp pilus assembly protein PilF/4-amino-4-deoxy-L-arabinose transferase-like glycosyltransferase